MGEWNIIEVIVVLVGLFLTVGTPVLKLNTTITKINTTLVALQQTHTQDEEKNQAAHKRLWKHNEEQDDIIAAHELRLHDLDGK